MYENFEKRETIACFNPKITYESDEKVFMVEGCLSYPGLWLNIKRPFLIEVEYENENGEQIQNKFVDLEARVFLHEYDHMEGSNLTEKVSKLKLDMAIKKQKKMDELAQRLKKKTEERLAQDKEYQKLIS